MGREEVYFPVEDAGGRVGAVQALDDRARAVGSALYRPLMTGFWAKRPQESSKAAMGRMNLFMVVYFWKMWGMNSFRQRRQVSHSWAVPGDS